MELHPRVSSQAVTLGAARTATGRCGSPPMRTRLRSKNPLAAVEAAVLKNARVPFPPFPEAARAQSIFLEEVQLAVLGRKPVNEAVASITSRVKPLLPA